MKNESAFPLPSFADCSGRKGMTLRDYFAGKAITGLVEDERLTMKKEWFAFHAYELADAMLKERAK